MIISKLIGGLGNQMFQYAAGLALAKKHRSPLILDTSGFTEYWRPLAIDVYRLDNQVSLSADPALSRKRFLSIFPLGFKKLTIYREPHFHYTNQLLSLPKHSYIEGYWQSARYFEDIRHEIIKSFTLKQAPSVKSQEAINDIRAKEAKGIKCVAIHVRRGDYVSNPAAAQVHGICEMDYYWKALEILEQRFPKVKMSIYLFSDSIDSVKESFAEKQKEVIAVSHNDSNHGFEDIEIMRHCSTFVIANSSFSWWGAWLSEAQNKTVIAPKAWFRNPETNTNDIIPNDWIRI